MLPVAVARLGAGQRVADGGGGAIGDRLERAADPEVGGGGLGEGGHGSGPSGGREGLMSSPTTSTMPDSPGVPL